MERNTLLAYLQAAFRELSAFSMPGIGFFSKSYQNARFDSQKNVLLPPGEVYQFSPENRGDDFLQRLLEQRLNLSPAQAAMLVADIVRMIQMELSQSGNFEIPKVGVLRRNAHGLSFDMAGGGNPAMEPISIENSSDEDPETANVTPPVEELSFPETNPQTTRKLMWWMAGVAAALMLGILTFSFYKTSSNNTELASQEETLSSEPISENDDATSETPEDSTQPSWNLDDNTLADEESTSNSEIPEDQLKTETTMPESPKIAETSESKQGGVQLSGKETINPVKTSTKTKSKTDQKTTTKKQHSKNSKNSTAAKSSKEEKKSSKSSKKSSSKNDSASKTSSKSNSQTTKNKQNNIANSKNATERPKPASTVAHREPSLSTKYFVIANSYPKRDGAEKNAQTWKNKGERAEVIWMKKDGKFGVSLGSYSQSEDAQAVIKHKSLGGAAKVYSVN